MFTVDTAYVRQRFMSINYSNMEKSGKSANFTLFIIHNGRGPDCLNTKSIVDFASSEAHL